MLTGTCHCGAVSIQVPAAPPALTLCNCSICRRLGALWAYYELDTLRITGHPKHTEAYLWGDRSIKTLRCRHCGCATHWEPLEPAAGAKVGVNMRNFEPDEVGDAKLRRFDGAGAWRFVDE